MILLVDPKLRKKVRRKHSKNKKSVHLLWIIEKTLWLTLIAFIILFPLYCINTGYLVSHYVRTGGTSYNAVFFKTGEIAIVWLFIAFLVWFMRKRVELLSIGGRTDETLQILDDKLYHTFRIKYESPSDRKDSIVIDLNEIKSLTYDENLSEISIEGKMLEEAADAGKGSNIANSSSMTERKVKICDYYKPSLYETLKPYIK